MVIQQRSRKAQGYLARSLLVFFLEVSQPLLSHTIGVRLAFPLFRACHRGDRANPWPMLVLYGENGRLAV